MSNPVINSIPAFDADTGSVFSFAVPNTPSQIYGSTILIRRNDDNTIVYEESADGAPGSHPPHASMLYTHPLTKEMGLVNGQAYTVEVSVYDRGFQNLIGTSPLPQLFYCFTEPSFSLNIGERAIIQSSGIDVSIQYAQQEGEALYESRIYLYSGGKSLLYQTDTLYDIDEPVTVGGLYEGTYYLQAKGVTEYGTELDTGLIEITIAYKTPSPTVILEALNLPEEAAIQLRSNIHAIFYDTGSPDILYLDNATADLRENWINYNQGFLIDGDFCCVVRIRACNHDTPIVTLFSSGEYQTGLLEYKTFAEYGLPKTAPHPMTYIDEFGQPVTRPQGAAYLDWDEINKKMAYFRFSVKTDLNAYTIQTDFIPLPDDADWFYVCVYRIGDLYHLFAIKEDGTVII